MTKESSRSEAHPQGERAKGESGHAGVHFVDTPGGRWRPVFDESLGALVTVVVRVFFAGERSVAVMVTGLSPAATRTLACHRSLFTTAATPWTVTAAGSFTRPSTEIMRQPFSRRGAEP